MTTRDTGQRAEAVAAGFLEHKGCRIIARNWRTRWCEIDVIAERDGVVYFCEVKYRLHQRQGSGLEYITPAKVKQMHFAAELWVATHAWQGGCQLCAIEVSGPDFLITGVVKEF
jgi:ribonuclease HII